MAAVEVSELVVRYGDVVAVDGVSLRAHAGEVLVVLGPNGAGKTSTVEVCEGLRRPTSGSVRVLGHDPSAERDRVVPKIGVMLQEGGVAPSMSPRDAVRLFGRLYNSPAPADEVLERVGITGRVATTPWRRLSGGEKQRTSLALALVGRPEVAFLDEPTAGIDPAGRVLVREVVRSLTDGGACVVLTTHDLDEAERIADRVVVMAAGRLAAEGTLDELRRATADGASRPALRFAAPTGLDVSQLAGALSHVAAGATVEEASTGQYVVSAEPTPALIAALASWLAERDVALADLRAGRSTLEDVYLRATAEAPAARPEVGG